ncbi:amidase signature enzyme [Lentinula aciculospora]|uniref:Amidase signature enzyme n=1 Tax=Lentinula aciculospora TaxID=153920 RepID=A0A9W9A8J7_9AGAR|nr:amidase signature enzyme [Lentinula aciculospora]
MQTLKVSFSLDLFLKLLGRTSANSSSSGPAHGLPDLYEATVTEVQDGLDANRFSSAYIARTKEVNLKGPTLRAVLEINSLALEQAVKLDKERGSKGKRGPLHGIPLLLKDSISTDNSNGNTTAGSFALKDSIPRKDAGVVTKLRDAGAIILGRKANLSEFGQFRSHKLNGGWSALGGQGTNAYYPNGDTCGSSSGSAVAVSIGLCALVLGTDTTGSITFHASRNNIVGIKPTVGLTSRAGDTVEPLTCTVTDAAILLSAIAGKDPDDSMTSSQPVPLPAYIDALNLGALADKRIGAPRKIFIDSDTHPFILVAFEKSLRVMEEMGATIVDPADLPSADDLIKNGWTDEELTCLVDFNIDLYRYLTKLKESPSGVRTLSDIIKFIQDHPDLEQPKGFVQSNNTSGYNAHIFEVLERKSRLSEEQGIDAALSKYNLDALVAPHSTFQAAASANAGYPMIQDDGPIFYPAPGTPFGISFFASAWSEYQLLELSYAYEQKTQTRIKKSVYAEAVPSTQL